MLSSVKCCRHRSVIPYQTHRGCVYLSYARITLVVIFVASAFLVHFSVDGENAEERCSMDTRRERMNLNELVWTGLSAFSQSKWRLID